MSKTPIKDSLVVFTEGAIINFKLHGKVLPVFGLKLKNQEPRLESVVFNSPADKDKFRQRILNLIASNQLEEFVFVAEAWTTITENVDEVRRWLAKYGSLEKYPDRKEIVQVLYSSPEEEICYTTVINRGSIGASLGEWQVITRSSKLELQDLATRFQGLFAQGKAGQN